MGVWLSKKGDSLRIDEEPNYQLTALLERIDDLSALVDLNVEDRLAKLEDSADLNSDGVVTREEMETYLASQLKSREEELIKLRSALKKERKKYEQLAGMYEKLRDIYNAEEKEVIRVSRISSSTLRKHIDEVMKDPGNNWGFLPDILEKPAKVKEYKLALSLLEKLFTLGHFDIAGHRIQGSIRPIEE